MTPSERRALLFLTAVALLGGVVRAARASREDAERPDAAQAMLAAQQAASDSLAARSRSARARTRKAVDSVTGPVDVDRAGIPELESLPRVGPVLAARIVADRDSAGPFGSLEELKRVRGIGPAMVERLAPHVTFSGTPRPSSAAPARSAAPPRVERRRGGGGQRAAPSRERVRR